MENQLIAIIVLGGIGWAVHYLFKNRKKNDDLASLSASVVALTEAFSTQNSEEIELETTPKRLADLEARFDRFELTVEEVREQALRHLQMASSRLQRATKKEEQLEDEGIEPEITQPIPEVTTPAESSNGPLSLDELGDIIRARGEEAL